MNREVELGSHSRMGCLAAELFSTTVGSSDTALVTLLRPTVERAGCGVHKLLGTGEVPITVTSFKGMELRVGSNIMIHFLYILPFLIWLMHLHIIHF